MGKVNYNADGRPYEVYGGALNTAILTRTGGVLIEEP